jgi:hexosaminidase
MPSIHPRAFIACFVVLLASSALAAPLPLQTVPDAFQGQAQSLIPAPQQVTLTPGALPLEGLSIAVEGAGEALTWAARDVNLELKARGFAELPLQGTGKRVRIGTLEVVALAQEAKTRGLTPDRAEGYALWVDANGAGVVGFDALGAYRGVQTLRQLLAADGFRFATVRDAPGIANRMAMIYLDSFSKGVNDFLVPMLARLKFSHVLVMSNYVRWDSAQNIWHPNGATKQEAQRVAELIRTNGMRAIPLIETPGHAQWFFYNNQNRDLVQDPLSTDPYAYDTLNPRTYEVLLPILKEAVDVFKPPFVHIGHDEVAARDRFPARPEGIALGLEKLFVDDTLKQHAYLATLGVGTMIWHDVALSTAYREKILPALPKDIVIVNWHYSPATDYPTLAFAQSQGFRTMGASWNAPGNPEAMAKAVAKVNAFGAVQTRWSGYFGNPTMIEGQTEQGVAYVNAGSSFWNPNAPAVKPLDATARYRDGYTPGKLVTMSGKLVNLSSVVTRQLADPDEKQWIQRGPSIDLSAFPTGVTQLGGYKFDVSGAVMLKGARAGAQDLPDTATLEINSIASSIAFLHTSGWLSPLTSPRTRIGAYKINYNDGTSAVQPLEYGRQITAWTDILPKTLTYEPVWRGKTKENLDVGVNVFVWKNPNPAKMITSIEISSLGLQSNPALIGLTLFDKPL